MQRGLNELRLSWAVIVCLWAIPSMGKDTVRPLRWGADAEGGAPYTFIDPERPETTKGFEVDLAEALAQELGRPIHFHQYNYDSLFSGLDRGDIDIAMNGIEITPERSLRVRFSRPYYIYNLQLVARAKENRFHSLQELQKLGLTVGTLGDTAAARLLESRGVPVKIYDGQREPYQDLALNRIDAVLMDSPIASSYAKTDPLLQFVGEPMARGVYAIAFPLDQQSLANEFDAALERLIQDGRLKAIYEKWQLWNDDQRVLADDPQLWLTALMAEGQNGALGEVAHSVGTGEFHFGGYFPLLLRSAVVTVGISVASMFLAILIALPIALMRLYGRRPLQWLATLYVEFFRGVPVLLLLYLLYYGIPALLQQWWGVQFRPSDLTVAVVVFGMNYAAYEAEIYRGALGGVPLGQWEAAASLGMSKATTFWRIILPQAIRQMIPPMTNDFVALFKDTSLVSVIAVVELTKQYLMVSKSSAKYMEVGLVTAGLYLSMSVPLGILARRLEERAG